MVFTTRVPAASISLLFVSCYVLESSDRFNHFNAHLLTTYCTGSRQGYGFEGGLRFSPTTTAFLFSKTSGLAQGTIQPIVQWVLWCCILRGPGEERIVDVVPRGTELELQLRRGIGQAAHTRNNPLVKCTRVY
jgi:hypothetical protein